MAHEINNLLASVLQAAQVIARRLTRRCPPTPGQPESSAWTWIPCAPTEARGIYSFLRGIEDAGGRGGQDRQEHARVFAQVRRGVRPVRPGPASGQDRGAGRGDYDLKKQYDFKLNRDRVEYDPGLPSVECQTTEIEQVFFNIIKNAAQALSELPRKDRACASCCAPSPGRGMAVVEIEDNGPGMPEETKQAHLRAVLHHQG